MSKIRAAGTAFIAVTLSSACISGPKTKEKSLAETLNGRNYEASPASAKFIGVPVGVTRRRALTQIDGKALLTDQGLRSPVAGLNLELKQKGVSLSRVRTNSDGSFHFASDLEDGEVVIAVDSSKFKGETHLSVAGFEIKGVSIEVVRSAAP